MHGKNQFCRLSVLIAKALDSSQRIANQTVVPGWEKKQDRKTTACPKVAWIKPFAVMGTACGPKRDGKPKFAPHRQNTTNSRFESDI